MKDLEVVHLCAFRYALGRKTYIVGIICDALRQADLSNQCKQQIIKEIKECQDLGMDMDRTEWMSLVKFFEESIHATPLEYIGGSGEDNNPGPDAA